MARRRSHDDRGVHQYGADRYPGQLVIQDVRTIHGSQFTDHNMALAAVFVTLTRKGVSHADAQNCIQTVKEKLPRIMSRDEEILIFWAPRFSQKNWNILCTNNRQSHEFWKLAESIMSGIVLCRPAPNS